MIPTFETLRQGIYQELLKANEHFKICWGMRTVSEDIGKVMDVYLTFFYFTMWSHHDRFCLGIYNVIKPEPDTANFKRLFNYIRSNKCLSLIFEQEEIEELEKWIKSHESLISRIKVIRDQYIAHNKLKAGNTREDITYKYEEGKKLLGDLMDILDIMSLKYDNSQYVWHVSPQLNLEDMLRHLTEYRNEQIRQRRGVIK